MVSQPISELLFKVLEILCLCGKESAVHVGLEEKLKMAGKLEVFKCKHVVAIIERRCVVGTKQGVHVVAAAWHVSCCWMC